MQMTNKNYKEIQEMVLELIEVLDHTDTILRTYPLEVQQFLREPLSMKLLEVLGMELVDDNTMFGDLEPRTVN